MYVVLVAAQITRTSNRHSQWHKHGRSNPVRKRRTYRSRRSSSDSYFTNCKWCGERIHMRQMPYGQWLAFDGPDSVHNCGQASEYGAEPAASPGVRGSRGEYELGAHSLMEPSSTPSNPPSEPRQQPSSPPARKRDWSQWKLWLLWIVVFYVTHKLKDLWNAVL